MNRYSTLALIPLLLIVSALLLLLITKPVVDNADWPMYRFDQNRSASSPHELSEDLHLHWVREMPEPRRAWPWQMDDQEKLAFDKSYEPIAADGKLFVASMVADKVTAYAVETGEEIWQYHVDGPVRFAPLYHDGNLYFVSDDGNLYCLNASTGEKNWKFRAAPNNRVVLGNERMISMWPARGAPVIKGDTLYFAAGMWPHEGVYIYALDAETAEIIWVNSGSQNDLIVDSKRYFSFGGVVPQGQIAVHGDKLIVPGGRTVPAVFNRHNGEMQFFNPATHSTGKGAGGHGVFAQGDWLFNFPNIDYFATNMYSTEDGAQFRDNVPVDLTTEEAFIGVESERIRAFDIELELIDEEMPEPQHDRFGRPLVVGDPAEIPNASSRAPSVRDRLSRRSLSDYYAFHELWTSDRVPGLQRIFFKGGTTFYGSGENGRIFAVKMGENGGTPEHVWEEQLDSDVFSMMAAHGRLFVTTYDGRIHCFGAGERETMVHEYNPPAIEIRENQWTGTARDILDKTELRGRYGLMFGVGSGQLLEALIDQSDLHITAYDPDPEKVAELRQRFMDAGLYGSRVAVHEGDATTFGIPPYIADLVVSEDPVAAGLEKGAGFARAVFRPLRPYGGIIYLPLEGYDQSTFAQAVEEADLENAELVRAADHTLLTRPGALPGSASWTHQYADAGNTAFSHDQRVKAPLGIAWFGGEPNHKALPKHLNGPIPQVVDGRLILLGPHHVSARCVYTGIELWATELTRVGERYISEEEAYHDDPDLFTFPNHPGANFTGSPYASATDGIYVIYDDRLLRLDPSTGEKINVFEMPDWEDLKQHGRDPFTRDMTESYGASLQEGEQIRWGNIRYMGDYLIAGAYPHMFDDQMPGRENNWNATSSEFVVVMDRYSGDIKWVHQARYGFRHNAIVAGNDKIFVIDNLSEEILNKLARRGIEPEIDPEIRALNFQTGEVVWRYDDEVFGTALAYSTSHDVLLQSGHRGRRRALPDEPGDRLMVLRGDTGEMLWDRSHMQRRAPLGMHESWGQILGSTGEGALDMLTGEPLTHKHPMTGETEEWAWVGALRCGTQNFSEHLVTFRSGAGGFSDLTREGMSGNITGFRPGCTNNMVVADGMLNIPEYSRGCECSYQNQTSMGLVHLPEYEHHNEMWTFGPISDPVPGSIERAGINFAAPGNRLDDNRNVLWVEYPKMVGPAPDLSVTIENGQEYALFRNHATWIENSDDSHSWVASYGIKGVERIQWDLVSPDAGTNHNYDVTLHFAEPDNISIGERVFDILVQGERHLENFDIVEQTGGYRRALSVTLSQVPVTNDLEIAFLPNNGSLPAVISGVEIVKSH